MLSFAIFFFLFLCLQFGLLSSNSEKKMFGHKFFNIFLILVFWVLKEPSDGDSSFEYRQHMFWLRNNFQKVAISGGLIILYEPWHEISNNVVCATSKGSCQPAHNGSLIRAFACRLNIL